MAESHSQQATLKRSLGWLQLTFYGVGTILGAGIFVVIGEVVAEAGLLAPIAYLLAALLAGLTALSYAEMTARLPEAGGPVAYSREAFGKPALSIGIGWTLAATGIVSAATITTGFVGYLQSFIALPHWLVVSALLLGLGGIAAKGIEESAWAMTATTLIGIAALVFVISVAGNAGLEALPRIGGAIAEIDPGALTGLFGGAILAFYAFIGFGDMAMTAEEVKGVRRTMPLAIGLALLIALVFYLLTVTVALGVLTPSDLAASDAPLVAVVEARGFAGWAVGIPALFVIVNGALTQIITATRLFMHMGRARSGAPALFGHVHPKTGTPLVATGVVVAIVLLLALTVPLKALATATSLLILLVFASVHLSLIVLKRRDQPQDVPNIPILIPFLGAAFCFLAVAAQAFDLWHG